MKVLVVGLGGIGQRHVRNLRAILGPEADLLAYRVRGRSPALTDNLAVESGVDPALKYGLRVFSDLDEALAEQPDVAFICNPSMLHLPIAMRAARAGCSLFVEKPIAATVSGVQELVDLAAAEHLTGMVGFQLRFHPCLVRLHQLVETRAVGRVLAARFQVGEWLPGWHPYEDYREMYASRADLGGGVVLSQIHELDLLYWLFGLPSRAFAMGGHLSSLEIDVEDVSSALLECEMDGRIFPVHVLQDYVQRPPARTIEVVGDAGKVVVDLRANILTWYGPEGQTAEVLALAEYPRNQLFLDEIRHFLACMAGQASPTVSLRDGLESLRIAEAIKTSLTTGQIVEIGSGTRP